MFGCSSSSSGGIGLEHIKHSISSSSSTGEDERKGDSTGEDEHVDVGTRGGVDTDIEKLGGKKE